VQEKQNKVGKDLARLRLSQSRTNTPCNNNEKSNWQRRCRKTCEEKDVLS
jgi:4-alpha-glucanotransferase